MSVQAGRLRRVNVADVARQRRVLGGIILSFLGIATVLYTGRAIAAGNLIVVMMIVGAVLALVMFDRLSARAWLTMLIVATMLGRGIVELTGLPSAIEFLHYPLVVGFAAAALSKALKGMGHHSRSARWLLGFGLVVLFSWVANFSHPLRAVIFCAIVAEPLALIWAMERWGLTAATKKRIGKIAFVLLAVQVPIGLAQGLLLGWQDPVQGTLVGHGAGAHVLGALFALGAFISVAGAMNGRISRLKALVYVAICFGMMIAAGAVQVVIASAIALVIMPLVSGRRHVRDGDPTRPAGRAGALIVAVAFVAAASVVLPHVVPTVYERTVKLLGDVGHIPELELARLRSSTDIKSFAYGEGPGTTASRASLLLAPGLAKDDSVLKNTGLEPTQTAIAIANKSTSAYGGSAESAASSTLGIFGDLGILGFAALVFFLIGVWRAVGRTGSWLTGAARAGVLMTVILMFIDNWLEYPEYTIALAILIAMAMSPEVPEEEVV